jgi:hypothetical protein
MHLQEKEHNAKAQRHEVAKGITFLCVFASLRLCVALFLGVLGAKMDV